MKNLSVVILAVAVAIGIAALIGADRYADLLSVSIEATEPGGNQWPAPGGQ